MKHKLITGKTKLWKIKKSIQKWIKQDPFKLGFIDRKRLQHLQKNQITTVKLNKRKLVLTDPYWFLFSHHEIFDDEIYRFSSVKANPLIIDCGSNIGLSILYFKQIYPDCRIIGFEPDPEIFKILNKNISCYELKGVELHNRAIWINEPSVCFQKDGSVGGKVINKPDKKNTIEVLTTRLRDLLAEPIDFLKIDIEGAEYKVITDCRDHLFAVDKIFVEYHGIKNEVQQLHEILNIFTNAGFRYHVKEANPVNHPFLPRERNRYYDLQLTIYGFRD